MRIVAGTARGRRLQAPPGRTTRPTSDRTREALFSTLTAIHGTLAGTRFLDLYAGSGAVGLEAWSRGAGVVTLVEQDRRTAALITSNAKTLGFPKANVVVGPVAATLARPPVAPYDVVFLDPPYPTTGDEVDGNLEQLSGEWVVPGGMVVVERSSRSRPPQWPSWFSETRERKYGETTLWYGHAAHPR